MLRLLIVALVFLAAGCGESTPKEPASNPPMEWPGQEMREKIPSE